MAKVNVVIHTARTVELCEERTTTAAVAARQQRALNRDFDMAQYKYTHVRYACT